MLRRSLPLWKLTRNRYGRAAYEALSARGVTATRMYRYRRDLTGELPDPSPPDGVRFAVRDPEGLDPDEYADFADPVPEDVAVMADRDGEIVGYLFLTADRPKSVEALDATFEFEGAYVWRVFVDPSARGEGIATALVARALAAARETWAVASACALVAVDNRPSQWVFEDNGFEREAVRSYWRVGPVERRRRRCLD
jgi:GNAT superfamily N-acetyltransferase